MAHHTQCSGLLLNFKKRGLCPGLTKTHYCIPTKPNLLLNNPCANQSIPFFRVHVQSSMNRFSFHANPGSMRGESHYRIDHNHLPPESQPRGSSTVYIYQNSKLFVPVVSFVELVKTSLWAVWVEQHETYTWFLPILARKESNTYTKSKMWLRAYCRNIYTVGSSLQRALCSDEGSLPIYPSNENCTEWMKFQKKP